MYNLSFERKVFCKLIMKGNKYIHTYHPSYRKPFPSLDNLKPFPILLSRIIKKYLHPFRPIFKLLNTLSEWH